VSWWITVTRSPKPEARSRLRDDSSDRARAPMVAVPSELPLRTLVTEPGQNPGSKQLEIGLVDAAVVVEVAA
jgi:hypothetical protein